MCEERKDAGAELTDEAVAEAAGGAHPLEDRQSVVTQSYTCPNCQFVYTFLAEKIVLITPPDCPNCGYHPEGILNLF